MRWIWRFVSWLNSDAPAGHELLAADDGTGLRRTFIYRRDNLYIQSLGDLSKADDVTIGRALGMTECPGRGYSDRSADRVTASIYAVRNNTRHTLYATMCRVLDFPLENMRAAYEDKIARWRDAISGLGYVAELELKVTHGYDTKRQRLMRDSDFDFVKGHSDEYVEDFDNALSDVSGHSLFSLLLKGAKPRNWPALRPLLASAYDTFVIQDVLAPFFPRPSNYDAFPAMYRRVRGMEADVLRMHRTGKTPTEAIRLAVTNSFNSQVP
jgi:hypothetical protein